MKKQRYDTDKIVRIMIDENQYSFGRTLMKPYVAFYDYKTNEKQANIGEIITKPIMFILCIYDYVITKGRWEIVADVPNSAIDVAIPLQFLQDAFPPYSCSLIDAQGNSISASIGECRRLERCAVWEPEHVEERIKDFYDGKKNIWAESLKLKEE